MPIDFNPHIMNIAIPQLVRPQRQVQPTFGAKDVFIKSIDPLYENIKIEKKSFGRIRSTGERAQLYTITNKKTRIFSR